MTEYRVRFCRWIETNKRAAGIDVGDHQRSYVIAILTSDHNVARQRPKMSDKSRFERPDANPGAGRKFKILSDPAIKHEALFRLILVGKPQTISEFIISLLVKRSRGKVRLTPVAWSYRR